MLWVWIIIALVVVAGLVYWLKTKGGKQVGPTETPEAPSVSEAPQVPEEPVTPETPETPETPGSPESPPPSDEERPL